ncbi:MAG TPA: aspartate--tRNA(Asn) ligase [Candidatus Saccharimonadia bacterium]|nr:aspartate--tRNA(Asn) ligase [Candidatus Saccharimonadia bacterium]
MKRLLTGELATEAGKKVLVKGWLHKRRDLGALVFVVLRDRDGVVQMVVKDEAEQKKLEGLYPGTVLEVHGTVVAEPRAAGGVEIHDPELVVISPVSDVPPIEIDKAIDHKSENFDTLFEYRALNLRNLSERAIFRVQAAVGRAFREYFDERGFTEIHTPKLLAGATEGGAEVFKTDYFGQVATLAQSPQFYKQMMVGALERVFEVGPVYRAEPSVTTRHMSEYISLDAEVGFVTFDELLTMLSELLNHMVGSAWKEAGEELTLLGATKPKLTKELPRLSMREIHDLYSKATGENTREELDLFPAEERWICEYAAKELGSEAVFVTEWPMRDAKFYHLADDEHPEIAVRADLLFRGIEVVTSSMREHRYDRLVKQLREMAKGDPESDGFKYFVSAFKYGMPPHGGFGMGLERVTQELIGLHNVKEASLFPRDTKRLAP